MKQITPCSIITSTKLKLKLISELFILAKLIVFIIHLLSWQRRLSQQESWDFAHWTDMMTSSNGNIFSRYWLFVRGIHRWPVNSPHNGQWRGALMFSLICACINGWVNNREAGDLRRHRAHYDVIVTTLNAASNWIQPDYHMTIVCGLLATEAKLIKYCCQQNSVSWSGVLGFLFTI